MDTDLEYLMEIDLTTQLITQPASDIQRKLSNNHYKPQDSSLRVIKIKRERRLRDKRDMGRKLNIQLSGIAFL